MTSFVTVPGARSPAGKQLGPTIVLPAKAQHTASFIMLHGLGDTGRGWADVATRFQAQLPHVKFVFPTAPTQRVSVNAGMAMPSWFDIGALDAGTFAAIMSGARAGFDPAGVADSVAAVEAIVAGEVAAGVPHARIAVGGFSQGGNVALRLALGSAARLAGAVALSTWLEPAPFPLPAANRDLPVLLAHGSADAVVPAAMGAGTLRVLQGAKGLTDVTWKLYPGMGHSSSPAELADVAAFLRRALPPDAAAPASAASAEELERLPARELKQLLAERGVSTVGLLEKRELVDAAKRALL